MTLFKKPMKAPNEILAFTDPRIRYPLLGSVKYDGFRMLNMSGDTLVSPALKPIPNKNLKLHLNNFLEYCRLNHLVTDGELWCESMEFSELSSVIRSHNKPIPDDLCYYMFDIKTNLGWNSESEEHYVYRMKAYMGLPRFPHVSPVVQQYIKSAAEAQEMFDGVIEHGGEGIILRDPCVPYKHGRCTTNENGMWKFKEFETHDAVIVRFEEQMKLKEGVERTRDQTGHLEREHSQQCYQPAGTLGAVVVNWQGHDFKVKPGKGYDSFSKKRIWEEYVSTPNGYIGQQCEFKYMPHGTKDKPRIGSLVRFRFDKVEETS